MKRRLKPKRTVVPAALIVAALILVIASKTPRANTIAIAEESGPAPSIASAQDVSFKVVERIQPIAFFRDAKKTAKKNADAEDDIKKSGALVVFTFDDGNESDFLLAYPILKKHGINGTSYINPYDADHEVKHKLSWEQIKLMKSAGWEFGDHTYKHMDLTKSTPEQIEKSMTQVNEAFMQNGLGRPDTFAYPYGRFNDDSLAVVRRYRTQARLAFYENEFADLKGDPYKIASISADMQKEERLKSREKLVDKACAEGAVIVFRAHCLYKETPGDTGKQVVMTSAALFEKLVDYCVDKGCSFCTMGELFAKQ